MFREVYNSVGSLNESDNRGVAKPQGFLQKIASANYSDVVLTVAVIAIIGLMIWPLPLFLIDTLVAISVLLAILLLLSAIYVPTPTALPVFPSALLLTTLLRLSLSIAITRQILLNADGGEVVETFGEVVAGGNIVVGLVVFLIITIVQFLVVAKGAERVAEVAARFSLDGMPGKQLSIDSDLRSNLIDKDEARRRRKNLELESQMHGSLDGAMKFVKGDAIAGIVIILVNLIAGLAIGILQLDMSFGDAVRTYSILTIGDGLVAQIPALLSSIAAGLIVTRTANDDRDKHLGAALSRQFTSEPRTILITGGIACLLMFVPGFPSLIFLVFGLSLVAWALFRERRGRREEPGVLVGEVAAAESDPRAANIAAPLLLELHPSLQMDPALAAQAMRAMTQEVSAEFGVVLPAAEAAISEKLPADHYRLSAYGARLLNSGVDAATQALPADALATSTSTAVPATGYESLDYVIAHCNRVLRARLGDFVGIQETSNLFNALNAQFPDLVKETLREVKPQQVTNILRRLVAEEVPITNMRTIMETLAQAGGHEKDVVMLTEHVRVALREQIIERYSDVDNKLACILVQPELEERLREGVQVTGAGSQLAVEPELINRVLDSVQSIRESANELGIMVVLCSQDVRRHMRSVLEARFPGLPVLSYPELTPDLNVVPHGNVRA